MRKNIFFLSSFILLMQAVVFPQEVFTVKGKIYDINTGGTLTSAMVYITNLETGQTDSTFTNSSGYWEYHFPVTAVENSGVIPGGFYVSQNYPNPFNPSTRVDISIPEPGAVTVSVYDALGRLLQNRSEYLSKGNYSIDWNAKGSAGVYFFNVKTKSGSFTRKMILLDGCNGSGLSGFRSGAVTLPAKRNAAKNASYRVRFKTTKFSYMPFTKDTAVTGGENFDFRMQTVHNYCTVADLHNDVLEVMSSDTSYHLATQHNYNNTDIPRLKAGGVDVQLFSDWVDPAKFPGAFFKEAERMTQRLKSEISLNPSAIGQAYKKADVDSLNAEGKIAAVLVVEGGHSIENDLDKLKTLYDYGMRYLTITWNNSTDWAVAAADSRTETVGLSEFGKSVIRALDSLGVIIDVSHTGIKTIKDILTVTKNPIIASHSGVRALRNHYRNLTDDQIKAIAASGGVIGVVFYPPFLTSGSASVATVVNHIDYIVNLVGIDYVAFGSDFDGIGTNYVSGLENVSKFPAVTYELLRRGYTTEQVKKITGGNFLRVFEKVCGK